MLAHKMDDGSERPVAYVSRTLSPAEKNYSQLDREALAVVFAVKNLHMFLHGRRFVLYTDHKPLLGLFGPERGVPAMASGRMQLWLMAMEAYEFQILHRRGTQNANALSRLPVSVFQATDVPIDVPFLPELIGVLEHIDRSVMSVNDVRKLTRHEPVLSRVLLYVQQGWPDQVDEALKPYFSRRDELSCQNGCVCGDHVW